MQTALMQLNVPLSQLSSSRRNPRKVKPGRDGHRTLVALIRSQGLLQPLVVRPVEGKPKHYEVVAGERRLRALREIHKGDGNPKIPCVLRNVDAATADAMSLGENFAREPMHPLDEADAFAKLATADGKDAKAIAAEFGVPEHYVRQRMKLATLAEPVKTAHRDGKIDTATAEAFAAVPPGQQLEVWQQVDGNPRHADHVRNVIAHAWIDATHALFDVSALPESAVSGDLFGQRLLVERQAFMDAQAQALDGQRHAMTEAGWSEVVVGRREDVQDRLYSMDEPDKEFDEPTARKLTQLTKRQEKLEADVEKLGEGDEAKLARLQRRFETLEVQEREIMEQAPEYFSEATKSVATVFLILGPDGRVHREYRVAKRSRRSSSNANGTGGGDDKGEKPKPPTSQDLSDSQLATTFTHQAIAVREALLKDAAARKRVLAMILHDKVRSEALSVRHEANGTTLHAEGEGFSSEAFNRLKEKRVKLDPLHNLQHVEDDKAYALLEGLSASKLDNLIDLLTVACVTAHFHRPTVLVERLASELKINVRDHWRPDERWLSGFRKIQLAHLVVELKGQVHAPAPERKKSELVELLAKLFADAAQGKLEDKQFAQRVNAWLPANLRADKDATN